MTNFNKKTETYRFIYDDEEIVWKDSLKITYNVHTTVVTNKSIYVLIPVSIAVSILMLVFGIRCIMRKFRARTSFDFPEEIEVRDSERA